MLIPRFPSDLLTVVGRTIEWALAMFACVAIRALSPPDHHFLAGWIGGAIFAAVYWRVWENIK